jgi:hypothetical protein
MFVKTEVDEEGERGGGAQAGLALPQHPPQQHNSGSTVSSMLVSREGNGNGLGGAPAAEHDRFSNRMTLFLWVIEGDWSLFTTRQGGRGLILALDKQQ